MKYDEETIISTLEHCTELDKDNFPKDNCLECPCFVDCKKCHSEIPYEMKFSILELLKSKKNDAIVHCRECKHRKEYYFNGEFSLRCDNLCIAIDDDFYCAEGEKR